LLDAGFSLANGDYSGFFSPPGENPVKLKSDPSYIVAVSGKFGRQFSLNRQGYQFVVPD